MYKTVHKTSYKMVRHTQAIRGQIADEMFECVFDHFVGRLLDA